MCRIECGHPGIFPGDVETKSFPDGVNVVQKLESSDQRCTVRHSATQVCRKRRDKTRRQDKVKEERHKTREVGRQGKRRSREEKRREKRQD